ncbi:MAG: GGDEF domain-containing protein [Cyanobium sp.]
MVQIPTTLASPLKRPLFARPSRKQGLVLALLTGLGVLLNLQPLPLFYGIQVLLGSTMPILALLLWRTGWSVAMAAIASLVTLKLWGHPWAVVIFTAEMAWLALGLERLNRRGDANSNGSVIPLSIGYWLLVGAPLVALFYGLILKLDVNNVTVTALKQSFNGILNTTLAFILYIIISGIQNRNGKGSGISVRGVVSGLVLLATTVPTLIITMSSGYQLESAVQQAALDNLKSVNQAIATTQFQVNTANDKIAYRRVEANGTSTSSNPELFSQLDKSFTDGGRSYVHPPELSMLVSMQSMPTLKKWVSGYWSYSQLHKGANGDTVLIQVVRPAATLVKQMQDQSSRLLGVVLLMLLLGTAASMALGAAFEREINSIIKPLVTSTDAISTLAPSLISELRSMVLLINQRIQQVRELSRDLKETNQALRRSNDELEQLNTVDLVTGCANRSALQQRLTEECLRCQRTGEPLSCITLDVDGLNAINDRYGLEVGDLVLKRVASTVRKRLRITDHFFRSGGDEFVIIATDCSASAANEMAAELQVLVSQLEMPTPKGPIHTSIAVGTSSLVGEAMKADLLLSQSDAAMRKARRKTQV